MANATRPRRDRTAEFMQWYGNAVADGSYSLYQATEDFLMATQQLDMDPELVPIRVCWPLLKVKTAHLREQGEFQVGQITPEWRLPKAA